MIRKRISAKIYSENQNVMLHYAFVSREIARAQAAPQARRDQADGRAKTRVVRRMRSGLSYGDITGVERISAHAVTSYQLPIGFMSGINIVRG